MKKNIFLSNFKGRKRKEVLKHLLKIKELRQKQIGKLNLLALPLKQNLQVLDSAIKSQTTLNFVVEHGKRINAYIKKLAPKSSIV